MILKTLVLEVVPKLDNENVAKHSSVAHFCETIVFKEIKLKDTCFKNDTPAYNQICALRYHDYILQAFGFSDLIIFLSKSTNNLKLHSLQNILFLDILHHPQDWKDYVEQIGLKLTCPDCRIEYSFAIYTESYNSAEWLTWRLESVI